MNRSIVALDCKTATMNIREEVKRETAKYVLYSSPHLKATIKNEGHIGNEKFVVPENGKSWGPPTHNVLVPSTVKFMSNMKKCKLLPRRDENRNTSRWTTRQLNSTAAYSIRRLYNRYTRHQLSSHKCPYYRGVEGLSGCYLVPAAPDLSLDLLKSSRREMMIIQILMTIGIRVSRMLVRTLRLML